MKVFNHRAVEAEDVGEGAFKVRVRWLIDEKIGAENFAMRLFELEPGGYTPYHGHSWEHEVFVLEGKGVVVGEDGEHEIAEGSVVFIPPNENHQFRNVGDRALKFLCLIPYQR